MPRTRFDPKPKRDPLGELIFGVASNQDRTNAELAEKLDVCVNTILSRKKQPDSLTIAEAKKLCKFLGIEAEELRAAIRF